MYVYIHTHICKIIHLEYPLSGSSPAFHLFYKDLSPVPVGMTGLKLVGQAGQRYGNEKGSGMLQFETKSFLPEKTPAFIPITLTDYIRHQGNLLYWKTTESTS